MRLMFLTFYYNLFYYDLLESNGQYGSHFKTHNEEEFNKHAYFATQELLRKGLAHHRS